MVDRRSPAAALVPLTGVLFVVFTVVGLLLGGEAPDADAPVDEVVEYWVDNEGAMFAGSILEVFGAISLVFFAASLRRTLGRRERTGILSLAAMGGGIVASAGIGVDAAIRFAAADIADADTLDPAVLQTFNAFWANFFFPMVVGLFALILATSLSALTTRVLPVWLGWVGIVLCIALATPAGFIAFIVSALWILIVSVMLWRHEAASSGEPLSAIP